MLTIPCYFVDKPAGDKNCFFVCQQEIDDFVYTLLKSVHAELLQNEHEVKFKDLLLFKVRAFTSWYSVDLIVGTLRLTFNRSLTGPCLSVRAVICMGDRKTVLSPCPTAFQLTLPEFLTRAQSSYWLPPRRVCFLFSCRCVHSIQVRQSSNPSMLRWTILSHMTRWTLMLSPVCLLDHCYLFPH